MSKNPDLASILDKLKAEIQQPAYQDELNYLVISRIGGKMSAATLNSLIITATRVVPKTIQICYKRTEEHSVKPASSCDWTSTGPSWGHLKDYSDSSEVSPKKPSIQGPSAETNRLIYSKTSTSMNPQDRVALVKFRSEGDASKAAARLRLSSWNWGLEQTSDLRMVDPDFGLIEKWNS